MFRETAQVRVGSLVASTLDIRDEDFIQGKGRFSLQAQAKDSVIINQGIITADEQVFLMAPQTVNTGIIAARLNFLGGDLIALDFEGDQLISFVIEAPLTSGFMEQGGQLVSPGEVYLGLKVASHLIRTTLNVHGLVEASTIQKENGTIRLVAGSQIAAKEVKVEAPLVINEGNFKAQTKVHLEGEHHLHWQGGTFEALSSNHRYDIVLTSPQGSVTLDGPIINPMRLAVFKSLELSAKVIDQNSSIHTALAPIVYDAPTIYLGGNLTTQNKDITFKGNVVIDTVDLVKIVGGYSTGSTITFMGTLDADNSARRLEIENNQGTVDFKKPLGTQGPLGALKISNVKNLKMSHIGGKHLAGVHQLYVEESNVNIQERALLHTREQIWKGKTITLKEGTTATFLVDSGSLKFSPSCKVHLEPHTELFFQGKAIEMPQIFGYRHQPVTIDAGHGSIQVQEMSVGDLRIQGGDIFVGGDINASSIFMEAHHDIQYAKTSEGTTFRTAIASKGDVTLNAKHGMVGTKEMPMHVVTSGHFYVGAKSVAYLDGSSADGYPHVYAPNPPPRLVFQGNEMNYVFMEDVFAEQEQFISLTPDLLHVIPGGFIHLFMVTPRRAPIYTIYQK